MPGQRAGVPPGAETTCRKTSLPPVRWRQVQQRRQRRQGRQGQQRRQGRQGRRQGQWIMPEAII
ncbi:hypothetical protein DW189_02540 [Alistipes sp. AM16-43]|nr:hypothetical protein DW189_02540 [Alistipes sp. AM16-43]